MKIGAKIIKKTNTNKLNFKIMEKTHIASKQMEKLGLHQVILTLNNGECTIQRNSYYNGLIHVEEKRYYENDYILDISWHNELNYLKEHEYMIINL